MYVFFLKSYKKKAFFFLIFPLSFYKILFRQLKSTEDLLPLRGKAVKCFISSGIQGFRT